MTDQMETIKDECGPRQMLSNGVGVRRPHIATNSVDRAAAARIEPMEEGVDGFALALLSDPDDTAALQIIDQGEILVTPASTDFVDTDDVKRLPATKSQTFGNGKADDLGDRFPVETKMAGHLQPTQFPRQHCNRRRQRSGYTTPWLGPGNLLDFNFPASRAADTERSVADLQDDIAQIQVLPCPLLEPSLSLIARQATSATNQLAPSDPFHVSNHDIVGFFDLDNVVRFHSKLFSDKRFHAHWSIGSPFKASQPRR